MVTYSNWKVEAFCSRKRQSIYPAQNKTRKTYNSWWTVIVKGDWLNTANCSPRAFIHKIKEKVVVFFKYTFGCFATFWQPVRCLKLFMETYQLSFSNQMIKLCNEKKLNKPGPSLRRLQNFLINFCGIISEAQTRADAKRARS